jgi:hypothetical protein
MHEPVSVSVYTKRREESTAFRGGSSMVLTSHDGGEWRALRDLRVDKYMAESPYRTLGTEITTLPTASRN